MKAFIHYIKNHKASEKQAHQALNSFLRYDWDACLQEGITPDTLDESEFDYPLVENGRLLDFYRTQKIKYKIKKSCISNQIRLWRKVVEQNETMAFIEHDAICIGEWNYTVDELLCLNIEYAFKPPTVFGEKSQYKDYNSPLALSSKPLDESYPLLYYKDNIYKNSFMIPGTAAYAISPKGAKKLLRAAKDIGIDQSDFFINTHNIKIDYVNPSPVKFNSKNLNTSHRL